MKVIAVILILLFINTPSNSQVKSAGDIDTLSQWRIDIDWDQWHGKVYDRFKYYISGTQVVDSVEYYQVFKSGYMDHWDSGIVHYEHVYVAGLREEGDRWYRLNYNTYEFPIYDFTLKVGDTAHYYPYSNPQYAIITDIDTVQINGEDKKRFHLSCAPYGYAEYIIEDVGSTAGLFEPVLYPPEFLPIMHCYALDFVPQWINPDGSGCDLTVNLSEMNIGQNISAYPNPFTTSTTIEYFLENPSDVTIIIYNSQGQVVERVQERQGMGVQRVQWNAEGLPAGMYYYRLQAGERIGGAKMVKLR